MASARALRSLSLAADAKGEPQRHLQSSTGADAQLCEDHDYIFTAEFREHASRALGGAIASCAELVHADSLCHEMPSGCHSMGDLCMLPLNAIKDRFAQVQYEWTPPPGVGSGDLGVSLFEMCPKTCQSFGYALERCIGIESQADSVDSEVSCAHMPGECLECAIYYEQAADCTSRTPLDRIHECLEVPSRKSFTLMSHMSSLPHERARTIHAQAM
ncbi:MAG: hypothetical protein SGPRY_000010 [Prymnesium sp.]